MDIPLRRRFSLFPWRLLPLATLVALLCSTAAADVPPNDGVPAGTVAFFLGPSSCPPGWMPATYTHGRMVVAVTGGVDVGGTVGTPLSDMEDRKHQHMVSPSPQLNYKSISAAGGGNNEGAAAQTYTWTDTVMPSSSGLPFIQALACEHP